MITLQPEEDGYYKINGTERILYWNGSEWMQPVKDPVRHTYGGYVRPLAKQPVRIKSLTPFEVRL